MKQLVQLTQPCEQLLEVTQQLQQSQEEALMSEFDFEIEARLRARKLSVRAPPAGRLEPEGDAHELDRDESRTNLPAEPEAGEAYEDVEVEKRVRARVGKAL